MPGPLRQGRNRHPYEEMKNAPTFTNKKHTVKDKKFTFTATRWVNGTFSLELKHPNGTFGSASMATFTTLGSAREVRALIGILEKALNS